MNQPKIQHQKDIAQVIYKRLKLSDPYCLLAGGAPRDWYLGTQANDLDFYFFSTATTVRSVEKQLTELLGVSVKAAEYNPEDHEQGQYKVMPFLRRVLEAEIEGMKVQFMQLTEPEAQFKVVGAMSVSICKVWCDTNMNIRLHEDFKLTLASSTMFLSDGYNWSDKHPKKIAERFPLMAKGTKEQAVRQVVKSALVKIK